MKKLTEEQVLDLVDGNTLEMGIGSDRGRDSDRQRDSDRGRDSDGNFNSSIDSEDIESLGQVEDVYSNNPLFDE